MSRASEWLAKGEYAEQPRFGAPGMIFAVGTDEAGQAALDVKGGWHTMRADQALNLAHWIQDTFGEPGPAESGPDTPPRASAAGRREA